MDAINDWYGQVPEFQPRDGQWGALLVWAYRRWSPHQDVSEIIMKYYGREDALLTALVQKYDPILARRREEIRNATVAEQKSLSLPPPPSPPRPGAATAKASARALHHAGLPLPSPPQITTDSTSTTPHSTTSTSTPSNVSAAPREDPETPRRKRPRAHRTR